MPAGKRSCHILKKTCQSLLIPTISSLGVGLRERKVWGREERELYGELSIKE